VATLNAVGAEKPFGSKVEAVDRANGEGVIAWTLRLAAQHDDIIRPRAAATSAGRVSRVSRLPQRAATIGSCN
jgi:hypothetical protein